MCAPSPLYDDDDETVFSLAGEQFDLMDDLIKHLSANGATL